MTRLGISESPRRVSAALMNAMSKPTLCPTTTASPRKSIIVGSTASMAGAFMTIDSLMPVRIVIMGGMPLPGLTRVCKVPRNSPARTLTMPISVIRSVLRSLPVVSMSSTQKVTSASGVPRSSKDRCPPTAMRIPEVQHERVFEVKNECSIRLSIAGRYSDAVSADSAADVPDGALRPALEFAVGMAAAGAKVRPPLSFPAELKRFLRFHKLPPAALAQVRAAVEGDNDFRKRLGSVVTSDLVDEVGVLWLSRPEGWAEAITALLPEKVVDDETALRREERKRRALRKPRRGRLQRS